MTFSLYQMQSVMSVYSILGKTNLDLWFFCKIIQLVAAEQLLHASALHLTYASCDVWLTMHQAISACLTSKILKFFVEFHFC